MPPLGQPAIIGVSISCGGKFRGGFDSHSCFHSNALLLLFRNWA
jgi:hypothetical protein